MIPEIEKASAEAIQKLQEEKLQELVTYMATNSPFYKKLFKAENIDSSKIKILEDLTQIPTTSKEDLQQCNDDFFCVPKTDIIDFVTTSGTLGDPVTIGLTESDLERLGYNEAISFACAGIGKEDILQLTTTLDRRFMAGLAYFLGARKLGAGIIRVGAGIPELQWDTILKFKPSYLIAVPSFLLKLIEYAEAHNIDYKNSSIKAAVCIGEALRGQDMELNTLGKKITSLWDIELFSTYASTEMSTAFTECSEQQGGHLHPELIIAEILDDKGNEVPEGYPGELTITTLGIEAMPLLRFRTGDVVVAHRLPCKCGRNTLRLGPVLGRKKQMIKYKGTTLYPPAMDNLLNDFPEVQQHIIEIYHNEIGTDEIKIKIAAENISEQLTTDIKNHFRSKLRISPKIEFTALEEVLTLQSSKLGRKPIKVIDKRAS